MWLFAVRAFSKPLKQAVYLCYRKRWQGGLKAR